MDAAVAVVEGLLHWPRRIFERTRETLVFLLSAALFLSSGGQFHPLNFALRRSPRAAQLDAFVSPFLRAVHL